MAVKLREIAVESLFYMIKYNTVVNRTMLCSLVPKLGLQGANYRPSGGYFLADITSCDLVILERNVLLDTNCYS